MVLRTQGGRGIWNCLASSLPLVSLPAPTCILFSKPGTQEACRLGACQRQHGPPKGGPGQRACMPQGEQKGTRGIL